MNTPLKKRRFLNGLAPAFLLPFLGYLIVMIVMGHKPFGSSSILYSDMYHQYYPFFVEFRNTLRSGGSLQYNWSVGMGIDYLPLIAYYLASPLNLFSALLPESWLLSYFSLLVPIKLGLAGLFFSIMLRKLFGGEGVFRNLFACFYALCTWALGYQWNIMWLDTFALLPLVFLGEIYLLRDKKFLLFAVTLFFSVACNYYIGLFTCIFVALIFFCYEISCWKGVRRFFADFGRIALFSLLALGMTAFLEIPAFLGLQNTYSSVNKFPTSFRLNITKEHNFWGLLDAMRQVLGNAAGGHRPTYKEGLPNIYCGVLTAILGFQFFLSKKIRLREKIISAFLLLFFILSFIIRQLDYIWHGFHFTNMIPYRFSFLYSFILLLMAYRAFLLQDETRPWQIVVSCVLFLGLCAMSKDRFVLKFLVCNLGLLLVYGGLLLLRRDHKEDAKASRGKSMRAWSLVLACTMVAELAFSLTLFAIGFGGSNVTNYPRGTTDSAYLIREMKEREGNDGFYRTEFTHSQALNDGALNHVHGISLFSSAANVNMTNFMGAMGCGAKPNYNRYLYENSSPAANAFFNLKYILEREGKPLDNTYWDVVDTRGNVTLAQNNAYLPLGFMTELPLETLDVTAPTAGSLSFQNELYRLATGNNDPIYTIVDSMHIDTNGIEITTGAESGYCSYTSAVSGDQVIYTFLAPKNGLVCLDVSGSKKDKFKVYHNDVEVLSESIGLRQIFSLDHGGNGDVYRIIFDLIDGDSGNLTVSAGVLDEYTFRSDLAKLGTEPLELTEFTDTKITGTVNASKTGLLYTSIPYDSNWTAYVDGKEAEITPIGNAMLAVKLESGNHTVQFRFQNQGYRLGIKISLACLFVLIAFYLVEYRPWDRKKVIEAK